MSNFHVDNVLNFGEDPVTDIYTYVHVYRQMDSLFYIIRRSFNQPITNSIDQIRFGLHSLKINTLLEIQKKIDLTITFF
jgi:uncharacterized protein YukJ